MGPIAQGRGIGHALLAQVESEVQARGGRLLLIETSDAPTYASARRLYETSGYRLEGLIHDFYTPGDNLLIFAKDLGHTQSEQEAVRGYQSAVADLLAESPLIEAPPSFVAAESVFMLEPESIR